MSTKQTTKVQLVEVLLPMPFNNTFTYKTTLDLKINQGDFVKVPFRAKIMNGCVWPIKREQTKNIAIGKIKNIIKKIEIPPLSKTTIDFIQWFSRYNCCFLGLTLKQYLNVPRILDEPKKSIRNGKNIKEKTRLTDKGKKMVTK